MNQFDPVLKPRGLAFRHRRIDSGRIEIAVKGVDAVFEPIHAVLKRVNPALNQIDSLFEQVGSALKQVSFEFDPINIKRPARGAA